MPRKLMTLALVVVGFIAVGGMLWATERMGIGRRTNALEVSGPGPLSLMEFTDGFTLDPLPLGWHHRRFLTRTPMHLALVPANGTRVVRCRTQGSASMLVRFVDVELERMARLEWRWMVEDGVESRLDERTIEGDDHPIRLFLRFTSPEGDERAMEIIWANVHLKAGEWKYLGEFPHYVAQGGSSNFGQWHDESVDLRELYQTAWNDASGVRLTEVALFCDSDETGDRTTAFLENVRLVP